MVNHNEKKTLQLPIGKIQISCKKNVTCQIMFLAGAVSSTVIETEGKPKPHYLSKSGPKAHDDCWLIGLEDSGHN